MIVLYPIKPAYIKKILSGEKKYELRRKLPANNVDYIVLYATYPLSKVVGYAKAGKIFSGSKSSIWKKVSDNSGLSKSEFMDYFDGCDKSNAIKFDEVHSFSNPFDISDISDHITVPQSFCYLQEEEFSKIRKRKTNLV